MTAQYKYLFRLLEQPQLYSFPCFASMLAHAGKSLLELYNRFLLTQLFRVYIPFYIGRALDDGVNFWTSLGSPHRFNAFNDGGQVQRRNFTRLDTWGPMDDSRGRGVQSYIDPLPNLDDGGVSLSEYRIGTIPTQRQCEDALKRWFLWHDLDHEQAQDKVWSTLSCYAKNRSVDDIDNLAEWLSSLPQDEVIDFKAIKFEVYKVLKLGGSASSREAHSRLYTRTSRSCNIFLRYQSYKEGIHPDEDGDSKLCYNDLLTGQLSFRGGDRRSHLQVSFYDLYLYHYFHR